MATRKKRTRKPSTSARASSGGGGASTGRKSKEHQPILLLIVEWKPGEFYFAWGGQPVPAKTAEKILGIKLDVARGREIDPHITPSTFGMIVLPENNTLDILTGDLPPKNPKF
jgi:hypothetical protein